MEGLDSFEEIRMGILPLTKALYRVSERFPEREPLRSRIRQYADEILAGVVEWHPEKESGGLAVKIDTIREYLLVVAEMGWVDTINIEVLAREYTMIRDGIQKELLWEPKKRREETEKILGELDIPVQEEVREAVPKVVKSETDFPMKFDNARVIASSSGYKPNERQKVILRHLGQAKQAKISDFFGVLEGVSSKTIQRDLLELINKNFLKKEGEKRWTVYSLNNVR